MPELAGIGDGQALAANGATHIADEGIDELRFGEFLQEALDGGRIGGFGRPRSVCHQCRLAHPLCGRLVPLCRSHHGRPHLVDLRRH